VISPGKGGSDDEIDGSTVLPSNPPLTGKLLMYQQYSESKQKQEEEKMKKREKETKEKRHQTTKETSRKTSSYSQEQDWKIST
jgi:hypothetical protein